MNKMLSITLQIVTILAIVGVGCVAPLPADKVGGNLATGQWHGNFHKDNGIAGGTISWSSNATDGIKFSATLGTLSAVQNPAAIAAQGVVSVGIAQIYEAGFVNALRIAAQAYNGSQSGIMMTNSPTPIPVTIVQVASNSIPVNAIVTTNSPPAK